MYGAQVCDFLNHGLYVFGEFLEVDDGVGVVGTDETVLVELLLDFFADVLSDMFVVVGASALQF